MVASKFLTRELRCKEKNVAEEYCWGGAVMLQEIKFGFQLNSLVYTCKGVFTKYHTTNKCSNCMSFILKSLF